MGIDGVQLVGGLPPSAQTRQGDGCRPRGYLAKQAAALTAVVVGDDPAEACRSGRGVARWYHRACPCAMAPYTPQEGVASLLGHSGHGRLVNPATADASDTRPLLASGR